MLTSKDTLLNPVQLGQTIVNQQVNTMWLTSSLFNQIASERIEALEPLTYLLLVERCKCEMGESIKLTSTPSSNH